MDILEKYLPFIKEQVTFQQKAAVKNAEKPALAAKAKARAEQFESLYRDIELTLQQPAPPSANDTLDLFSPVPEVRRPRLTLLPADLEGLPEAVLKQLSINNESDRQELAIVEVIEQAGGVMSLDQLIIALWRQRQELFDRGKLNSKLYRMTQKEMIYNAGKGVYSTKPMDGSFSQPEEASD